MADSSSASIGGVLTNDWCPSRLDPALSQDLVEKIAAVGNGIGTAPCLRTLAALAAVASLAACDSASVAVAGGKASESPAAVAQASVASQSKAAEANAAIADRFLKRFPATYDYDILLADSLIQQALHDLLGEELAHFRQNMAHLRRPIDVVAGDLVLYGMRNDLPAHEEAVLCVSFHPLRVHVGIYSDNAMIVYSQTTKYEHLPSGVLQWVYLSTRDTTGMSRPPLQGGSEFSFEYKVVAGKT